MKHLVIHGHLLTWTQTYYLLMSLDGYDENEKPLQQ